MATTGKTITLTLDAGLLADMLDEQWAAVMAGQRSSHTYDNLLRAAMAGGLRLQAGQVGAEQLRKGEF